MLNSPQDSESQFVQTQQDESQSGAVIANELLNKAVSQIDESNFDVAFSLLQDSYKVYSQNDIVEGMSVSLSWIALCRYLIKQSDFSQTLSLINEAKFLADKSASSVAIVTNYFVLGILNFYENNLKESKTLLEQLKLLTDNKFILDKIEIILQKIEFQTNQQNRIAELEKNLTAEVPSSALITLLRLGRLLAAENNVDVLIETIAKETSKALGADRCTVFMLDNVRNELWSKVALGMELQEIRFPSTKGLAGHVAMTGDTINIKDAYNDERFNPEIDTQTGYVTKTILCMPIRNIKHEIVGVFQVLNKQDGCFTQEDEDLLVAIGSSAGIALENTRLFEHQTQMLEHQKHLFSSFIDTLAASIDARDKITSGHSSRVRMYSELISKVLNLSEVEIDEIKNAATLHDIGKIGIRDSVLQKEGKLTDEEYVHIQQHVLITHEILSRIYMSEEYGQVARIASAHHEKFDGSGYFQRVSGKEIPLGGRILAVADVFDAITSKRHYRDKMPIIDAINIMKNGMGTHFDPDIVEAFLSISCDKMVQVFLTEFEAELSAEHGEILKNYSMFDLYNLLSADGDICEQDKYFLDVFNLYYMNKSQGS